MVSPLLETKLYVPKLRRGVVPRPRLSERLNRALESKVTLVSAPAGFGKTTLLAEWRASAPAHESATAWLSLEPSDNHAALFWTHLIAALRVVAPGVGAGALSLLESPGPPIEASSSSRCLRSLRACRTAPVLDSPVSAAISLANRSVSASLMFNAMV